MQLESTLRQKEQTEKGNSTKKREKTWVEIAQFEST